MGCGASSTKGAALSPSPGELGSGKHATPSSTSKKDSTVVEDQPAKANGSASAPSANGGSPPETQTGAPPPPTPPVAESAPPAQSGQAVEALLSLVGASPGGGGGPSDAADEPPPRPPSQQSPLPLAPLAKRPSAAGIPLPPPQSQASLGKLPPLVAKNSKSPLPPIGGSKSPSSASLPTPSQPAVPAGNDASTRPALLVPRLGPGPITCLAPPARARSQSGGGQPSVSAMEAQVAQLASSAGLDAQCSAAARIREALCSRNPPVQALLDAGLAAPLVRLVKEGPAAARVDAAWALVNIAASSEYVHPEALCNESAAEVLVEVLNVGKQRLSTAGGSNSSGAASTSRGDGGALAELSLWALGNIAGAMHPGMRTQALAVDVLDAGALRAVIAVMEQEAAAPGMSAAVASPLLRVATWCLHNLAKHKREKEMVDAIPVVTKLLTEAADTEVLTCAAWVLAFLGSNEDNKSHMKQALPALPRLVQWVREASSSLATPSLLSVGTMCTGYMRALDYSEQVVEAGGVPAMLSYLQRAAAGGLAAARRAMVKEALFALSNVAGANCGTVRAMLDAGVFPAVIDLLRQASGDDEILNECLYVLTNPWDPLVGADVPTSRALVDSGILQELHSLLDPAAPAERLSLLLKGLGDGLKRGQQLMTYEANMRLVEHGPEAAASMPAVQNPVVTLYVQLGTVQRIGALNSHTDEEVHTRANGMITVLRFFME